MLSVRMAPSTRVRKTKDERRLCQACRKVESEKALQDESGVRRYQSRKAPTMMAGVSQMVSMAMYVVIATIGIPYGGGMQRSYGRGGGSLITVCVITRL